MANPQPTVSFVTQGNQLYLADPTTTNVFHSVVALNGFQGLGGVKSSVKLTNFDSAGYDEFAPGLVDPGKPSGTVILNYGDASHQFLQAQLALPNTIKWCYLQNDGLGNAVSPTASGGAFVLPLGTALATPTAPTIATASGGSLAAATYYYKVTNTNLVGETLPSTEASQVTSASGKNTLTLTPDASATSQKIYRSTTSGAEVYLATVGGAVTSFVDDGSLTPGTATPPVANTTGGYARSGWEFSGFVSEFSFQAQVNNVAMCKLSIQATGARSMIVLGGSSLI